jgi:hypothetical protein
MVTALRHLIGKVCHVYLDDIIIWSNSVEEHVSHVRSVLLALRSANIFCSPKKTNLFCLELDFLGHHISSRGIEADSLKADKILAWPVLQSATDVRAFLGLVRYLASFLPDLASHTAVLNPLTNKECDKTFPPWSRTHQFAFDEIKRLVNSRACLTVIDYNTLDSNRVFVTCNASDLRTGAYLSFGSSWTLVRPVAYDSAPLSDAERNYPVHKKELLAIIRALKKWRSELLGVSFVVYTAHRTLEHFMHQKGLSRRQARWQELLADFDFTIKYVKGEDNSVADALSHMPTPPSTVVAASRLTITSDAQLLQKIKQGYETDKFASELIRHPEPQLGVRFENGLLFLNNRLVVPNVPGLRESLFHAAHDSLGHFGAEKSYAALCNAYYWPHMRSQLEDAYVPSCNACQRNKSRTSRRPGPLHPLPVPYACCDSVAIDFVGPLPLDHGFNYLVTMTDRLGSDVRLVAIRSNLTAEAFAGILFEHWYCNHGLPLEIISDRDRLFTSCFWQKLHKLSGVKLKMSTAYHPQTDVSSKRTNKTIIQMLRFYIDRRQKGWVKALPRARFELMSTVNKSTGFSPFQLLYGRAPRLLPPLPLTPPSDNNHPTTPSEFNVLRLLRQLELDCWEAQDNLTLAKVCQAMQSNRHRGPEIIYKPGDLVMLSTLH